MLNRWRIKSWLLVGLIGTGMAAAMAAAPQPGLWQFRIVSHSRTLPWGSQTQILKTCLRHPVAWIPPAAGQCASRSQPKRDARGAIVSIACITNRGPIPVWLNERANEHWATDGTHMTVTGMSREQEEGQPVLPVMTAFSATGTRVGPCR